MDNCRRKDSLTAAKVEVGLVFNDMLSVEDAAVYLASNDIAEHVTQRVLAHPGDRRASRAAALGQTPAVAEPAEASDAVLTSLNDEILDR